MRKLKIALFNESFPPFIDGVANVVKSYADIIHENYGDVFVVTPRLKGVYDDYPYRVIRYHSVPTNQKIQYPAGNPLSVPAIREILKEKPDLIHVHSPFSCSVLAKMCTLDNEIPVVVTYHTKFEQDIDCKISSSAAKRVATKFVKNNLKSADEIWAVSSGCGDSLRTIGYKGPYRVMHNGTDFKKGIAPQNEIDSICEKYRIAPDETVLLYVGRMMWYKNIKLILESVQRVYSHNQKIRLVMVGDGLDMSEIKSFAKRMGMLQYVTFTGAVRDRELLRAFYSRADLFLFPSTYDTSGLVVKEAAACGTPSVLVKNSCAAEGVVDGMSGFLCDENVLDCSNVIMNTIKYPSFAKEVGENASKYVYLSWDDAVEKAYSRYEDIISIWHELPRLRRHKYYTRFQELTAARMAKMNNK